MRMRLLAFTLVALAIAPQAFAQMAPPAAMKLLATSADVQALIAKAKADRKDGQIQVSEEILQLAPYRVSLEYRALANLPAIHEKDNELFYILEGSGTLTVGGTLVDSKRTNPTNLSGSAIQGGTEIRLSKGDFYIVPQNTPHMMAPIGGPVVDMSLHLPGLLPAQ